MATKKGGTDYATILVALGQYLHAEGYDAMLIDKVFGWFRKRREIPAKDVDRARKILAQDPASILGPRPSGPTPAPLPAPTAAGGGKYSDYLYERPVRTSYQTGDEVYQLPRTTDRDIYWVRPAGTNELLPAGAMLIEKF